MLAAFGVGVVVGLTGMGGGALMTPLLVLFFGVPPLAAVSSDLVASAVMKPVGSLVHLRNGTVRTDVVARLCAGSVPAAFTAALLTSTLADTVDVDLLIRRALGVALLLAAAAMVIRVWTRDGAARPRPRLTLRARPAPLVAVGVLGGLVVGCTSVGSGSLIMIVLMSLYPRLSAAELVGTDLAQAVPLVAAAAAGHLLFGDFRIAVTIPVLLGAIPGTWLGARLSCRLHGGVLRCALAVVLCASAVKLLGA